MIWWGNGETLAVQLQEIHVSGVSASFEHLVQSETVFLHKMIADIVGMGCGKEEIKVASGDNRLK